MYLIMQNSRSLKEAFDFCYAIFVLANLVPSVSKIPAGGKMRDPGNGVAYFE